MISAISSGDSGVGFPIAERGRNISHLRFKFKRDYYRCALPTYDKSILSRQHQFLAMPIFQGVTIHTLCVHIARKYLVTPRMGFVTGKLPQW